MAAKHDHEREGREGAEETDIEEADGSTVVMVLLPKEALARIDARAAHPRGGGSTRAEVIQRLLRRALDAAERVAAKERIIN